LTPDDLFLVDEAGQRATFGEFDLRVERVAGALAAAGITAGTKVAWQLPTRISTALLMAALRRLDAVQSPIIAPYRPARSRRRSSRTTGRPFLSSHLRQTPHQPHLVVPGIRGTHSEHPRT